jgi:hypothetical protein
MHLDVDYFPFNISGPDMTPRIPEVKLLGQISPNQIIPIASGLK